MRVLSCLLLSFAIFIYYIRSEEIVNAKPYLPTDNFAIDRYEDHILAINFAKHNEFPVLGFLSPESDYKFGQSNNTDLYFGILKQQGPIPLFARHPLYPFCMGLIYKICGVNPVWDMILAVIMYSLIIGFLPLAGFYLIKSPKGFIAGIVASVICLAYLSPFYHSPLQIFTTFWCFSCFLAFVYIDRIKRWKHLLLGFITALTILSKGVFVLSPILYILAIIALCIRERSWSLSKKIPYFLIGFGIVFLPWFLYINNLNIKSQPKINTWVENLKRNSPREWSELNYALDLEQETDGYIEKDYMLRCILITYMSPSKIIITTNQMGGDMLLAMHNELCIDANWHLEYKEIPNLYINQHSSSKPNLIRILEFYINKPEYMLSIPLAKFHHASVIKPNLMWLAIMLQGLFMLQLLVKKLKIKWLLNIVIGTIAMGSTYFFFYTDISSWMICSALLFFIIGAGVAVVPQYRRFIFFSMFFFCSIFSICLWIGLERYIQFFVPISALACSILLIQITQQCIQPLRNIHNS